MLKKARRQPVFTGVDEFAGGRDGMDTKGDALPEMAAFGNVHRQHPARTPSAQIDFPLLSARLLGARERGAPLIQPSLDRW
jgi:hypothetical protein